jgi:hypothetical protein
MKHLFLLLLAPFFLQGDIPGCVEPQNHFYLAYTTGISPVIDRTYGTIGFFYVPWKEPGQKIFADMKAHFSGKRHFAINLGLGYRQYVCQDTIIGANAYYDYGEGRYEDRFTQMGVGLELLREDFTLHLNGYFPSGKKRRWISDRRFFEISHTGFDALALVTLFNSCGFTGRAGPGAYGYFQQHDVWGAMALAEIDWRGIFFLRGKGYWDNKKHLKGQIQLAIELPFELLFNCHNIPEPSLWAREVRRQDFIYVKRRYDN